MRELDDGVRRMKSREQGEGKQFFLSVSHKDVGSETHGRGNAMKSLEGN